MSAPVFDVFTDGGSNSGSTSSLSFNHVTGSGSNRVGYVEVLSDFNSNPNLVTGVTWNGVAMTLVATVGNIHISSPRWLQVYQVIAPPVGSASIVISASGTTFIQAASVTYFDADQTQPLDNYTTNQTASSSDQTLTTSLTSIADNCKMVVFEEGYDNGNVPEAGTGSVVRSTTTPDNVIGIFDSGSGITPAGSYSMQTTRSLDTSIVGISHIMISIGPVGSAPPTAATKVGSLLQMWQ